MSKSVLMAMMLSVVSTLMLFAVPNALAAKRAVLVEKHSVAGVAEKSKYITASLGPTKGSSKKTNLMVLGDSLGDGVWAALYNAFRKDKNVKVMRKSKSSTGFVRLDYYDWNAELAQILTTTKIDVAVVMVGANDRQTIVAKSGRFKAGSKRWRKIYASRVDTFIRQLKAQGAKVYWVGLPITRRKRLSRHMRILNEIFTERARANNITFVDIWDDFATLNGRYSANGKDITGRMRKLRANDGVHFTMRGYRKLALATERFIRADITRNVALVTMQRIARKPVLKTRDYGVKVAGIVPELSMMAPQIIDDVVISEPVSALRISMIADAPEKIKKLPVTAREISKFRPNADYLAKNLQKTEKTDVGGVIRQALANDFQGILSIVQPDKAVVVTSRAAIAQNQAVQLSKIKAVPQRQQMRKTATLSLNSDLPRQLVKAVVASRDVGIVRPVSFESGTSSVKVEYSNTSTFEPETVIKSSALASIAPVPRLDSKITAVGERNLSSIVYRTLLRGDAVPPKAGRGDDFSWPRD